MTQTDPERSLHKRIALVMVGASAALALSACGGESPDAGDGGESNNAASNNGASNNGASNNGDPGANTAPVVDAFDATSSAGDLTVSFDWSVSDADADELSCTLDVDSDGTPEITVDDCAAGGTREHTYGAGGAYTATLVVTDTQGASASETVELDLAVDCPDPEIISEDALEAGVLENLALPMECVDYLVTTSRLVVTETSTIAPGVVMAFEGGVMQVGPEGLVEGLGTAELPIVLTDAQTSPDGWAGLYLSGGAADLAHVTIENAGNDDLTTSNYDAPANITLREGGTLEMRASTVRGSAGFGIFSDHHSSLPVFEDNTITGNALGAVQTDAPVAHAYRAGNSYTGNGVDGVFVITDYAHIDGDVTWEGIDVPFVVGPPALTIPEAASLTIGPGAAVEFEDKVIVAVHGELTTAGTEEAPVTLTAHEPDTLPWSGLVIRGEGVGRLAHTVISHGGGDDQTNSNYDAPANITLREGGTLEMRHSTLRDSAGFGIFSEYTSSLPVFEGNTLTANASGAVRTDVPAAHFYKAGNSYTGNGADGILVNPRYGAIEGDVTWEALDVPFVITRNGSALEIPGSLNLKPGVRLHLEETVFIAVFGSLTSQGTEQERIEIRNAPGGANFGGILVDDGAGNFAYTTILNGGGVELGFDDLEANVVVKSFTSTDEAISIVTFGDGMMQSGAPYGLAFDNWAGSDGTTMGINCGAMGPIYYPYPDDRAGQC